MNIVKANIPSLGSSGTRLFRIADNNPFHAADPKGSALSGLYLTVPCNRHYDSYAAQNYVSAITVDAGGIFPWTESYFPTVHVTLTGGGGTGATAYDAVVGWQAGHEGTVAEIKSVAVDQGGQNYSSHPAVALQWVNGPPSPPATTFITRLAPYGFHVGPHDFKVNDLALIRWLDYDTVNTPPNPPHKYVRYNVPITEVTADTITIDRWGGYPDFGETPYYPGDPLGAASPESIWGTASYLPYFDDLGQDDPNKAPGRFAIYRMEGPYWFHQDRDGGPLPLGSHVLVSDRIRNPDGYRAMFPRKYLGRPPYWGTEQEGW